MAHDTISQDRARTERLRQMLRDRRQAVQHEVEDLLRRRRATQAQQWTESVPDAADHARNTESADRELALLESRSRLAQQFDEALQQLEDGRYGICIECGAAIGLERLKAVPFAKRCVSCQEKAERIDQLEHASERRTL